MVAVLFVCLGNICRSPAAEGMLRHLACQDEKFAGLEVQSCAIGDWHVGQLPDLRMREAAQNRSIILSSRAQEFHPKFFEKFDYILAADHSILNHLYAHAKTPEHKAKIHLMTVFSSCYHNEEVKDPYYGGDAEFERVLDVLEDACQGILDHLRR